MLKISTTAVCPKCRGATVWYEDGKFTCHMCGKKYASKEITKTHSDLFEIATIVYKQKFIDKFELLQDLAVRFNAERCGYDPTPTTIEKIGFLDIGWENGYPVRLNMLVQELNEILD